MIKCPMDRSKRQAAKASAEQQRQYRAHSAEEARKKAAAREVQVRAALSKPVSTEAALVEKTLAEEGVRGGELLREVRLHGHGAMPRFGNFDILLRAVVKKAPRLITPSYVEGLYWLSRVPWARPIETWEPRGKGRDSNFNSIAEHLLMLYRTPSLFWSAFFGPNAHILTPFAAYVAMGGSVSEGVKTGLLTVPLTRKMCHELVQTSATHSLTEAIRRVQVRTHGGDIRLLRAWMNLTPGSEIRGVDDETFWNTVLAWLAQIPMLDMTQVHPMVDYVIHRRNEDRTFSMKGRTPAALMRAMREWHEGLTKVRETRNQLITYKPSGFKGGEIDKSRRLPSGNYITEICRFEELLTSKALASEGAAMKHCVYSYSASIERGMISIWAMSGYNGERLTIEVRNDLRRIVQARGKYNRMPDSSEMGLLNIWAGRNNLTVSLGRW